MSQILFLRSSSKNEKNEKKKKAFVWEPSIEERLRPKLRLNETGGSPANLGLQWEGFFLKNRIKLVVSTQLKNISQIGNLPQVGVKMKNIWNHHPAWFSSCFKQAFFLRTCGPAASAQFTKHLSTHGIKKKRQLATDEFAPHLRSAPVAGNGRMEKPQWKRKCLKACGIGTNWNRTKLQLAGKNPSSSVGYNLHCSQRGKAGPIFVKRREKTVNC